ncbi:hypothetical protein [Haladaptatus halobius]|uniref:hypothetical protein n=1 Tax=Haladaptatus halobius TaxID=2884875 RepID=UPI001D09AF03|nr:hypothetical protein [Haladaptatus halobius]
MTTSDEDSATAEFITAVQELLSARENVLSYDIREATPKSALVVVEERTQNERSTHVLYRIQQEVTPQNREDIHLEYLGPVDEDETP